MSRGIAFYSGVLTLLLASPALAHHPGGTSNTGGAGPIWTISASTLEAGHGAVAFLYEYVKFGGLGDAQLIDAAGKGASAFELCLTHPDGTAAPAQGQHQHDQCALHCAAAAGVAALAIALIALVFPLRPVGYVPVRRAYRALRSPCRAGLSRAPPLPA